MFNVHARSIFPCENMGIGVLFEYPACILDHGDRVRVFGKLRADVMSLVPPTTLEYVSERRVVRGQHSLHFDCELFSERYVEYCFVYVSQAISGAVADVRMDCVPTTAANGEFVGEERIRKYANVLRIELPKGTFFATETIQEKVEVILLLELASPAIYDPIILGFVLGPAHTKSLLWPTRS